jgi:hypothetical protein
MTPVKRDFTIARPVLAGPANFLADARQPQKSQQKDCAYSSNPVKGLNGSQRAGYA